MAFKTFTAGEVLTAANVNDYLMEQAVIVCTSATRPASPNEGMTVYETDTDLYSVYNGTTWVTALPIGAWSSYTPSWTASSVNPAIGDGTITGRYAQSGKIVHMSARILMGSTTTFGTGGYEISLPVTAATVSGLHWTGSAYLRDASAGGSGHYTGICVIESAGTTLKMFNVVSQVTPTVPFTWANTDHMTVTATYQGA